MSCRKEKLPSYINQGVGRGSNVSNDKKGGSAIRDSVSHLPQPFQESKKFVDASAKIHSSVKEHLEKLSVYDDTDESESEEVENEVEVVNRVIKNYANEAGNTDVGEKTKWALQSCFDSDYLICLVCIESVRRPDPIWSCTECYGIFHLVCMQQWIKDGAYHKDEAGKRVSWFCPKCRHEYPPEKCPTHYYCYCLKIQDPENDPWTVPHSCGQRCGKVLKRNCDHPCWLLCHPGECPPCPLTVRSSCYCGQSAPTQRRCAMKNFSCGRTCNRLLHCEKHKCPDPCHAGICGPCSRVSSQSCLCGSEIKEIACSEGSWRCEKVCERMLSCGYHKCEAGCHLRNCMPCSKDGVRVCPCGKKSYTNLSCAVPAPSCGDLCSKPLACGLHRCMEICHEDPCGKCHATLDSSCRCGTSVKHMICEKEWFCNKRCDAMRNCGRHACRRRCCDGKCTPCEQLCGRRLACGTHKCAAPCHDGPCYPCSLTVEVYCPCKKTVVRVPCGRQKMTRPPACRLPCEKVSPCPLHRKKDPHRCHFGPCPRCNQVCGKLLDGCSHTCLQQCHLAVKRQIFNEKAPAGPWEGPRSYQTEVNLPCPSCQVLVEVTCLGGHETASFPCTDARSQSCGRLCGNPLSCGNHVCDLQCHAPGSPQCSPCEEPCRKPRPEFCSHVCPRPCHNGPCPVCREKISRLCYCGSSLKSILCCVWCAAWRKDKQKIEEYGDEGYQDVQEMENPVIGGLVSRLLQCGGPCTKQLPCGHPCPLSCHGGICGELSDCSRRVTVRCPCKRRKVEQKCKDAHSRDSSEGDFPQSCPKSEVECDKECFELQAAQKKSKEEKDILMKKETLRAQQQELEAYERKFGVRTKKRRQVREEQKKLPFYRTSQFVFFSVCVVLFSILIYFLFM